MVIVVPTLSKGDEREDEAILAIIARFESGFTHDVSERVNTKCAVVQEGSADAKTPREHLKGRGAE